VLNFFGLLISNICSLSHPKYKNMKQSAINTGRVIAFPQFTGIRCLMMPYIQGQPNSVPEMYAPYHGIIESVFFKKGDIGFLTIDESPVFKGKPHRGDRARCARALHTEAGRHPVGGNLQWGWGCNGRIVLDRETQILLANNLDHSCAVWDAEQEDTSRDGDIGYLADVYPYESAVFMKAGEVHQIGILTPHESLPVESDFNRQFLRIISSGVHGHEDYFTVNPLVALPN
jgi:hypothetical protein